MSEESKKRWKKGLTIGIALYAALFLFLILVANGKALSRWFGDVLMLFRPILLGLALSYICNPFFKFYERKCFRHLRPVGLRRALSLILAYLTILLFFVVLIMLILPNLAESFKILLTNWDSYMQKATSVFNGLIDSVNKFMERFTGEALLLKHMEPGEMSWEGRHSNGFVSKLGELLKQIDINGVVEVASDAVSLLTDIIFAFFISVYLLGTKEKRYAQIMKLRYALFNNNWNRNITKFLTFVNEAFGSYLIGKLMESFLMGLLLYCFFSLFGIPYALLAAVFIAITNIVPIIGAYIGAVPTAFIILLAAPFKVIPFLAVFLVLQQINANIISPKILGERTGISALCVLIGICIMGSVFGLTGMILGVPIFATVLYMLEDWLAGKLQHKGLPVGVENYYPAGSIVNPAVDANVHRNKIVFYLEHTHLRNLQKETTNQPISRYHRILDRLYLFARQKNLISALSDETVTAFSAECVKKEAAEHAEALFEEKAAIAEKGETEP